MSTQIGRRLNRLETRLGVSDNAPKIDHIIVYFVKPSSNGFKKDVRAAKLDSGKIVYRGADETLEDFQNRIRQKLPKEKEMGCRMSLVTLGTLEDFSEAPGSEDPLVHPTKTLIN